MDEYDLGEHDLDECYSIGDLSKIVHISTDALRYYDEIGLLEPFYIDPNTRYRYYSKEQINTILHILELKQYGFPLKTISRIVKDSSQSLLEIYKSRYTELSEQSTAIMKSMAQLTERIQKIEGSFNMKQRILIIDDAPIMRMMLNKMFTDAGYTVLSEAQNGKEGIDLYEQLNPDVVVLDIFMPEMDGIDTLKGIKRINPNAKVVMCSARGQRETILKCFMLGANNFVVKPFISQRLVSAVEIALMQDKVFNMEQIQKLLKYQVEDNTTLLTQDEIDQVIELCKM